VNRSTSQNQKKNKKKKKPSAKVEDDGPPTGSASTPVKRKPKQGNNADLEGMDEIERAIAELDMK
jgi:hypothetical protein